MKIDFLSRRVILSNAELKRATDYGGKEYFDLLEVMRELPDFQIEKRVVKSNRKPSPTFESMSNYLSSNEDAAAAMNTLQDLRKAGHSYFEIKKWFLSNFPDAITQH